MISGVIKICHLVFESSLLVFVSKNKPDIVFGLFLAAFYINFIKYSLAIGTAFFS